MDIATAAGSIIYGDAGLIWGIGADEEAARADADVHAARAGVSLEHACLWTVPATARLLSAVERLGGDIRWTTIYHDGRRIADLP